MSAFLFSENHRGSHMPFKDEHGFSTTGIVLSLILTISLVFSAAQVYRINAVCAHVQSVADAAALAAENQVSKFVLVTRMCDAIVLTLSLTGLAATGLGLAALCTPVTAGASEVLIKAGKHIIDARNVFSDKATAVLEKLQVALPFFAATASCAVAQANSSSSLGSNYIGIAVLVPFDGESIRVESASEAEELLDEISSEADSIRDDAAQAEQAAEEANRSKERAFARDCGDDPEYCMSERAGHLAGLAGGDNPVYSNVDAWSFSVALRRAQIYYHARYNQEAPHDYSYEEQTRSALRARFYRYAANELDGGYVYETDDTFEAYLPHLPSNTSEMRFTSLYTDVVYPITFDEDDNACMHAWAGCPNAVEAVDWGSIQQLESGEFTRCEICNFTPSSMGNVANASSSIPNGFEYLYEAVADEAFIYQQKKREALGPKSAVTEKVGALFEKLAEVARETVGKRLSAHPPGRYGAIALVSDIGGSSVSKGFASPFVADAGSLGPTVAVSAATLVEEDAEEDRSAVSSLLDSIESESVATGAARIVLSCWSRLLNCYRDGQEAVEDGIRNALNELPLVGASGLGTWAANKLQTAIGGIGLQPAETGAVKPLLLNTSYVASKAEGDIFSSYVAIKQQVALSPPATGSLFDTALGIVEANAIAKVDDLPDTIEVASIQLFGEDGPSVPITIPIPESVKGRGIDFIDSAIGAIRSLVPSEEAIRIWQ